LQVCKVQFNAATKLSLPQWHLQPLPIADQVVVVPAVAVVVVVAEVGKPLTIQLICF